MRVDLLDATNGIDGSRDVPLEFGDVVEIPEREHALGDRPIGLTDNEHDAVGQLSERQRPAPGAWRGGGIAGVSLPGGFANWFSSQAPGSPGHFTVSSDLSRVKVTRHDPVTGKNVNGCSIARRRWKRFPQALQRLAKRLHAFTERSRNNGQWCRPRPLAPQR